MRLHGKKLQNATKTIGNAEGERVMLKTHIDHAEGERVLHKTD